MGPMSKETCKAARMLLNWTAANLADESGIPPDTLRSFESGRTRHLSSPNEHAIRSALEAQGIQFLDSGEVAAGPGVALKP